MTNSKSTKRALLTSSISLILCFAMLLGTTFAWFTDSVTSANNVIKSGNLDVNLYYWDNSMDTGTNVSLATDEGKNLKLFRNVDGEEILWEPGATGFGQFEVANEGTLALKYKLMLNFYNPTETKPDSGKTLADVLSVYAIARNGKTGEDAVMEDDALEELRTTYMDSTVPGFESQALKDFTLEGYLLPGESFKYELGAFWKPSDKDNEYNVKGGLSIDFGATLIATQMTYEKDSYDEKYDETAEYPKTPDFYATTADKLIESIDNAGQGEIIGLTKDIKIEPANMSNAYGTTGINIKNGQTLDGNGNTLDIKGAGGTWDSGINTTGGIIKNLTVTGSFRGIFINHNSPHSERVVLENVIIDGTTYTISCDQGTGKGLTATRSTFNGWTSYAATIGDVEFTNCNFGEGNGYAYCRPYAPTAFVGCEFEAGFTVDPRAVVTFENCTVGGVKLTAENLATLVTNTANATVK